MIDEYITLNQENIEQEHLCCAIADKKHQQGVEIKKAWLKQRLNEGHVFRKLNAKAKVFIEYAPLEKAWVPIDGKDMLYIYCLWVAGSYKDKGYAKQLLNYCLMDAKKQGKQGVCVLSSSKKKPFLADKKFFEHHGFKVVDKVQDYELLVFSFNGDKPVIYPQAKLMQITQQELTIYYGSQCPYIHNCIQEITDYCQRNHLALNLVAIDDINKAKSLPCIFNNWAVFYKGNFVTHHLLNANSLQKILAKL
ncbi:MAG: N-acetyltransferase [Erysipelotrichaceae bacterium]|nr:N-acetyltransferase [Erysipelotrichaceae bacterium]MDY5251937.1 GNAT family N-acetyltransferase [Erysipelotrichaceae bacterium]